MKTLYFDCFAGAAGDMILGALVALGVKEEKLLEELKKLRLEGWEIEFSRVDRSGINAAYARVSVPHEHKHRHLHHIEKIIADSDLSESVKARAIEIFTRLAEAEARVHGISVQKVHFHEVGAMDAILDVVGACIGIEMLGVEKFAASRLHVGSGFVRMEHGNFPVPPPAVAELVKEKNAPIYSTEITGELLTPTAAAIITTLCDEFGQLPNLTIEHTGYGAGTREYKDFPNVLRLILGDTEDRKSKTEDRHESLILLETNIDDETAETLGFVQERAFELGALDCWLTPVLMKKSRQATKISVLCSAADKDKFLALLFAETTTLGVRSQQVERISLKREIVRVETIFGEIDIKVGHYGENQLKAAPEYEQCRAAALKYNVPLREVVAAAKMAFAKLKTE